MTTLIKCRACACEISANAQSCPNCGEPNVAGAKPKQTATGFLAALLIGLIIGGLIYVAIMNGVPH